MSTGYTNLVSPESPAGRKLITGALFVGLAIIGYLIYQDEATYGFMSESHFKSIIRAKIWSLGWVSLMIATLWAGRRSLLAPNLAVFAVAAYFVVLYGILFHGTEFGLNGYSGDMAGIYAKICKMMAFNSFFQDWFTKDLPSLYPPLWFATLAFYGDLIGIEAYQTYRFGFLLVFLVYPWLLYVSWKRLTDPVTAAVVSVATLFLATKYVDSAIHEHVSLGLFIPWWLYYFESRGDQAVARWRHYLFGSLIAGLLFMTYYYWFFAAFAALPLTLGLRYYETRSISCLRQEVVHRVTILLGVAAVSSIYWFPLLLSVFERGFTSAQNVWFFPRHANLAIAWNTVSLESILIFLGVSASAFLWDYFGKARLSLLYVGCFLLILADRLFNLNFLSLQTRKIFDFVHVLTIAPFAIALVVIWRKLAGHAGAKRAIAGLLLLGIMIYANGHTELHHGNAQYRVAFDSRVPSRALSVFDSVDVRGKVLLTYAYAEAAFIPYYSFTPANNMSAHLAGQYWERVRFLELAGKLTDPELLAYVLAHNRYDEIDFIYLPRDPETGKFRLQLNQVKFNVSQKAVFLAFDVDFDLTPRLFARRHSSGLYELQAPTRDRALQGRLTEVMPEMVPHLKE